MRTPIPSHSPVTETGRGYPTTVTTVTYGSHGGQDVDDAPVQTLPVGHDVPQGVEVSGVLHRQVQQRQQLLYGRRVCTERHPGVSLRHQQPVETEQAGQVVMSPRGGTV